MVSTAAPALSGEKFIYVGCNIQKFIYVGCNLQKFIYVGCSAQKFIYVGCELQKERTINFGKKVCTVQRSM